MTGPALIAMMIALATPTAHGSFQLQCLPTPSAGITYIAEERVILEPMLCRQIGETILHRHMDPLLAGYSFAMLLHEAAHIAQGRDGVPIENLEHDAECRSLLALPSVLRRLRYSVAFARRATDIRRANILHEPAPYGGTC